MPKEISNILSIYIPKKKMKERPVERLIKLAEERDRSVNYLVVDAILQYLEREEGRRS
jgi:predicted transcriptional regulator